ncbi:MAG TPA: D-glycero-beta-D-manno-heptose 1-phosphate adenylyltransferase [Candidatus Kapabacteria bacterium]|nr:D-glycero-beta-D-manno-heptose 1-phosphate adenylyltransferase [Candidatus Kapabacteria bacterium]
MPHPISSSPIFRFRNEAEQEALRAWCKNLKGNQKQLVFTNGVFDLLHRGHVHYLLEARNLGDALIIGVNADASVKRLKGDSRPIQNEEDRAYILSCLKACDAAVIFDEDTPLELVTAIIPDVLVKGGDYEITNIVGRDVVESNGGVVKTIPIVEGRSTTNIVQKMKS